MSVTYDEERLVEEEEYSYEREQEYENDGCGKKSKGCNDLEESARRTCTATTSGIVTNQTYTVDEAIEMLGFGPFQVLITVFSGLLWLADAMELMLLSVLSPAVKCNWSLTPAEEATITSIVFVGFLIGGVFWGTACDFIGRKKGLLLTDIVILVFGILSAMPVAPDTSSGKTIGYPWLLICRFGVGIGAGGTSQSVTYYAEFLPPKARGCCLTFIEIWWAIGSMFGALLALAVMDSLGWHWYLGLATVPLLGVLFLFPFVPESARFYVIKGEEDKARRVIEKIAKYNRKPVPQGCLVSIEKKEAREKIFIASVSYSVETGVAFEEQSISPQLEEIPLLIEDTEEDTAVKKKEGLYYKIRVQILRYSQMFSGDMWKTTTLLWIIWLGCAWLYYGVVLLTTTLLQNDYHCYNNGFDNNTNETCVRLGNDDYIKIFWTAVAELPGLLVTILIIEVLGRKKTMALEFILTMVGFLLLFICSTPILTTFFLFVIRAFATGVFQAVFVYTPEVYATNIRSSALGVHTAAARIGALVTPFSAQVLLHSNDYATISLYAASCFVLAILSLLLPIETKGRAMKDEAK